MTKRLFLAGLFQETCDFSPIPTGLESFGDQAWRPNRGEPRPADVNLLGYGAVLDEARRLGVETAPGPFLSAVPAARCRHRDWLTLKAEVMDSLEAALPVGMAFLFLHGAMTAEGEDDCAGDLAAAVRERLGTDALIGVELDLHANLTERLARACDVLTACKEYPHIDFPEEGRRTLDIMLRAAGGEVRPVLAAARLPLVTLAPTGQEPIRGFVERLREHERTPGVLSVSALYGFAGADHPDMGAAAVVVLDGDRAAAEALAVNVARDLAKAVRAQGQLGVSVAEALDIALAEPGRTIIADRADNPGGGAGGDSTHLLAELLHRGVRDAAVGYLWDPVAVDLCHRAGEGARLRLRIGGKLGPLSGDPLDLEVEVTALADDVRQPWFGVGEAVLPMGRSAAVRAAGVDVVLGSVRHQVFSRAVFEAHGLRLEDRRVIVVKSTQHFFNAFADLGRVVYCDAPGSSSGDISTHPYRRRPRPLWPLEIDADLTPKLVRR